MILLVRADGDWYIGEAESSDVSASGWITLNNAWYVWLQLMTAHAARLEGDGTQFLVDWGPLVLRGVLGDTKPTDNLRLRASVVCEPPEDEQAEWAQVMEATNQSFITRRTGIVTVPAGSVPN